MISQNNLDFWIRNNYNVLFTGEAGVGKTSIILQAWKRQNLNFAYLSGSTLDPWVDFIGVPKEKTDPDGEVYLDLVRPKQWAKDEIEALFIDEYNRAPKKVRNAVMELIQFKSINGKKFEKLKMVWVAINPDDSPNNDYDVEPLDPAQKDRFQIWVEIPFKPSFEYFRDKYGDNSAQIAIDWWNSISSDEIRRKVSPRRLDYALDVLKNGGDLRFVLPEQTNIKDLVQKLKITPIAEKVAKFYNTQDVDGAKAWIAEENNYSDSLNLILAKSNYTLFYLPVMPEEKIASLICSNEQCRKLAVRISLTHPAIKTVIDGIIENGQNKDIVDILKQSMKDKTAAKPTSALKVTKNPSAKSMKSVMTNNPTYDSDLDWMEKEPRTNTIERRKVVDRMKVRIPKSLSALQINRSLTILEDFIMHSNRSTRAGVDYLVGLCNHVYENSDLNGITYNELEIKYPYLSKFLLMQMDFYYMLK